MIPGVPFQSVESLGQLRTSFAIGFYNNRFTSASGTI